MITVNVSAVSVRLLLRILRHQQSSFVLQRSEDTAKMTEEALRWLNPKETTLQTLTEVSVHVWLCVGSFWKSLGLPLSALSFSRCCLPGNVRGPDPREDEGGLAGRRESGQCVCAELQGALVE